MVCSELVWPAVWIPVKTVKQTSWAETWLDPEKKGLNFHQGRFKQLASNYDGIRGGGLTLYVNNRWCSSSHVKVRTAVRNKHTELLAIGLRPYYLPWEFSLVIIIIVYIAPDANAAHAYDVISSATVDLLNQSPSTFVAVTGDFNHTNLSTVLPTFKQYVDCKTRDNKTLYPFYTNATEAYTSILSLPCAGLITTLSTSSPFTNLSSRDNLQSQKLL